MTDKKRQPISTHKNARHVKNNCDIHARTMFNAMLEHAESSREYEKKLMKWLDKKEGTSYLRDELCLPFKKVFFNVELRRIIELSWYNAFSNLDSASLRFQ